MAKKESPPRKKPYPKNKPESISDGSDSESEVKDSLPLVLFVSPVFRRRVQS